MEENIVQEERILAMFEPDTLLPAQFYDENKRKTLDPEKQLMLAILEDTIACFQKNFSAADDEEKREFRDAENWINDEDRDWLFSFNNICEALEFDPGYLRQGLARWKEQLLRGKHFKLKHAQRYSGSGRRKIK